MEEDQEILTEKKKYDLLWKHFSNYREFSPGETFTPCLFAWFHQEIQPSQTVIDFGCGTARAALKFLEQGLRVILVDISNHCLDEKIAHLVHLKELLFFEATLWKLPKTLPQADWIYCCDVLEHIATERIEAVLSAMASKMKRGGYFSICLKEDLFGKNVGFALHQTVKDRHWWIKKLSKYFEIYREDKIAEEFYLNCAVRVHKRFKKIF